MLIAIAISIVIQFMLAAFAPRRFVLLSLWFQAMPYTWNWNTQMIFDTPIGPLNVIAMQVFGFCIACLLVVAPHVDKAVSQVGKFKWHALFFGFCMVSLLYAPSIGYGLRMMAKLVGPFLFMIAVLVSFETESELREIEGAIIGSGMLLLSLAIVAKVAGIDSDPNAVVTGVSGLGPPSMGPPVFSAHMLPVAMVAIARYMRAPRFSRLIVAVVSAGAVVAALQRTSAAALFLGVSAIFFLGASGVRRIVLPIVGVLGLPVLLLSESFRRRMFFGESSSQEIFSDPARALENVNGSGRFGLWGDVLSRFFEPHPIVGSGIGSTQNYLYGLGSGGAGVVHSEYVRLLCEVGFIGFALFACASMSYLVRLRGYASSMSGVAVNDAALPAFGSLVSYLVFFSTDNGIDYVTQFGIYVFALIAAAEKLSTLPTARTQVHLQASGSGERAFSNLMT